MYAISGKRIKNIIEFIIANYKCIRTEVIRIKILDMLQTIVLILCQQMFIKFEICKNREQL